MKAVLFDLFETLILTGDDEAYYPASLRSLHKTLAENGIATDYETFTKAYFAVRDQLYTRTNQTLEEPHFNNRIIQTLETLGINLKPESQEIAKATQAFADTFLQFAQLDPQAIPVLTALKGKYKLGIISNFAIPEAVWKLLDKLDIRSYFDTIIISGEINRRKPSEEVFQKALLMLNLQPSEAVFVGDTLNVDVKGAQQAGMKAILINRRPPKTATYIWKPPEQPTTKTWPDATINQLVELMQVIQDR